MENKLTGYKVAILVTNGFEQSEMEKPKKAIEEAGGMVQIIAPNKGKVKGWKDKNWGDDFDVDVELRDANSADYLGLILPGGVMSPDQLRMNALAIAFIADFIKAGKPIAAICHGPWTLINAEGVKGKTVTSWPSLQFDLVNAGAKWVDKEVVRDNKLITSRKPDDLPAFNLEVVRLFNECKF